MVGWDLDDDAKAAVEQEYPDYLQEVAWCLSGWSDDANFKFLGGRIANNRFADQVSIWLIGVTSREDEGSAHRVSGGLA